MSYVAYKVQGKNGIREIIVQAPVATATFYDGKIIAPVFGSDDKPIAIQVGDNFILQGIKIAKPELFKPTSIYKADSEKTLDQITVAETTTLEIFRDKDKRPRINIEPIAGTIPLEHLRFSGEIIDSICVTEQDFDKYKNAVNREKRDYATALYEIMKTTGDKLAKESTDYADTLRTTDYSQAPENKGSPKEKYDKFIGKREGIKKQEQRALSIISERFEKMRTKSIFEFLKGSQ